MMMLTHSIAVTFLWATNSVRSPPPPRLRGVGRGWGWGLFLPFHCYPHPHPLPTGGRGAHRIRGAEGTKAYCSLSHGPHAPKYAAEIASRVSVAAAPASAT